jgi:hypothetical protein
MKKSQTATEYLIILAVIIVIALIVVGLLGGIPGVGGGSNKRANDAKLATNDVGITGYTLSSTDATFTLRNNRPEGVIVNQINITNQTGGTASCTPLQTLNMGEAIQYTCNPVELGQGSGNNYNFEIKLTWSDSFGAAYTDEGRLIGRSSN